MAIVTTYELFDFLPGALNDFSITATDKKGSTQSVITSDNALKYFLRKYGTRRYSTLTGMVPATQTEAKNNFNEDFRLWVTNRQRNIDLQYQALFDYDYSPIDNYDRHEIETIDATDTTTYGKRDTESGSDAIIYGKRDTESGSDAVAYGKSETLSGSDTFTDDTTTTLTKDGSETHTIQKAGFNSPNTYTPNTKDQTSFSNRTDETCVGKEERTTYGKVTRDGGTDTTTYGKTNTQSGTDTTTYGKTNTQSGSDSLDKDSTRDLHAYGNIGVTTSTAMISELIEARNMALAEMLLDNFINDYTFYS